MGVRRQEQIQKMINSCTAQPRSVLMQNEVDQVLNLRKEGASYRQIAKQTRFSHQRVHQIVTMVKRRHG